ncbi:uncharacterized protein LOC128284338 [Gossypium arboreum]|uniref:uncharacterized protein LOC128284338 n=1 Tax=Gossypium arboreum TaxID=29729 RepID=UPI0022F1AF87|nr:uncharacterized protein LOC128284338 [Gossypium arboreum]
MPNYVKFVKDILSNKKRLSEYETVALTKESSAFLQNKLPPKLKDPGSFTIPCNIGESYCDFEVDKEVSIILGRLFLATGRTLIDMEKGELTIRVQDDQVTFNILKAMNFPDLPKECLVMKKIETLVSMASNLKEDPLEKALDLDPLEDE